MYKIMNRKAKGFTLIELLVVIAVLGILVLLAMPKFKGHIEKAHLINIQNDVKISEGLTEEYLINDNKLPDSWESISIDELTQLAQDKKLYDVKGLVVDEEIEEGEYVRLTKKTINTKLKGEFYANKGGKVYYEDAKVGKPSEPDIPMIPLEPSIKILNKDDLQNKRNEAEKLDPDDYENFEDVDNAIKNADEILNDTENKFIQEDVDKAIEDLENAMNGLTIKIDPDFEWIRYPYGGAYEAINEEDKGYYKYIGADECVEIPHKINGHPMTSYYQMFYKTGENVKKVISTNANISDMRGMFEESKATSIDLSNFVTSNVEDMSNMFRKSKMTQLDLSNFDTSSVTTMYGMFYQNQATELNLSKFNTSNVTNMSWMFMDSQATSIDLSSFDTNKVTDISRMFEKSKATSIDLSNFDTSNVTNMSGTFSGISHNPIGLENLDTSSVTDMRSTFSAFKGKEINISGWDTSKVTNMGTMFSSGWINTGSSGSDNGGATGTPETERIIFGDKWTTKNVSNMRNIFTQSKIENIDLLYKSWDLSNLTNISGMFEKVKLNSDTINMDDYNINYSKIRTMINTFAGTNIKAINFGSRFNTSNVTSMQGMFYGSEATSLDLSNFNTKSVQNMGEMFYNSKTIFLDLSNFNTKSVINMGEMFYNSRATELDLSNFDISNVIDMERMFMASYATSGYARTQTDADKFNNPETNRPSRLTFVVK